jgi:hypothetical protein
MRYVALMVAVLFLLGLWAVLAQADAPSGVAVTYGGKLLLRIRDDAGGYTKEQRAAEVEERLVLAMTEEFETDEVNVIPDHVRIVPKGSDRALMAGDILMVTITPADARSNNTTPDGLAGIWLKRLISVLDEATKGS